MEIINLSFYLFSLKLSKCFDVFNEHWNPHWNSSILITKLSNFKMTIPPALISTIPGDQISQKSIRAIIFFTFQL